MASVPVITYAAGWNPVSNQGRIFIQAGGGPPQQVPVESQEEFLIMLLMMGKSGVQFDSASREIEIPFRPTGS